MPPSPSPELSPLQKKAALTGQSKRMKITRACDECRKRKVKCDGVQPCLRCRKSELSCVFAKHPPKRGPPKQYIELLEARLQLVERALRTIDGPARQILDDALSLDPAQLQEGNGSLPSWDYRESGDFDRFSVNEIGQAMYVGDCPERADRVPGVQHPATPHAAQANTDAHEPHELVVPPELIDAYFEHVHKYCPMIYKPQFRQQMKSKTDSPSRLLLYAMGAVASRWRLMPSIEQEQASAAASATPALPPGFSYYRRASALLDDHAGTPSIPTIQALVLLAKYQEYYARVGFFRRQSYFLCRAVRMCNDLGLSQLDTTSSTDDLATVETRKRTFWMTFLYDLMTSIEQGQEPYFGQMECTTDYPLASGEEDPTLEEAISNHNLIIQLGRILSPIYAMARRVASRQQQQQDTRSMQQVVEEQGRLFLQQTHLETFLHELPGTLTYAPTQDANAYPAAKVAIHDVFVGCLHMTYHFAVILLHRHYVLHPFPETDVNLQAYEHRRLCAASASNITHIVESLLETHQVKTLAYPTRGIQHTIHCLATAATVHKYEVQTQPDGPDREAARQQLQMSLHLLRRLATESPAVELHSIAREAELTLQYEQLAFDTAPPASASSVMDYNMNSAPSSPRLSGSVDTAPRSRRTKILPKHRRHTLTGTGAQIMQMAAKAPPSPAQRQYRPPPPPPSHHHHHQQQQQQHLQTSPTQHTDPSSTYLGLSQTPMFHADTSISDPSQLASIMQDAGLQHMTMFNDMAPQQLDYTPKQQHTHYPQDMLKTAMATSQAPSMHAWPSSAAEPFFGLSATTMQEPTPTIQYHPSPSDHARPLKQHRTAAVYDTMYLSNGTDGRHAHPRRHTISIPDNMTSPLYFDTLSMQLDPKYSMDERMLMDIPSNDGTMNPFLMADQQMAYSMFEDIQRSEGHVLQ